MIDKDLFCIIFFLHYVAKFRELCPGGLGYTVLPNPPVSKPVTISQKLTDLQTPLTLPTTERPVEPFGQTEEIIPGESLCNLVCVCSVTTAGLIMSVNVCSKSYNHRYYVYS